MATVLMVAEKPSLAASIASHLSAGRVSGYCLESAVLTPPWCPEAANIGLQMQSYRQSLEVHEFEGSFMGKLAHFKMTSVIGHVLSIDFPPAYQNWETTDPATLFTAPTVKSEANPKVLPCQTRSLGSKKGTIAANRASAHKMSRLAICRAHAGTCLPTPAN